MASMPWWYYVLMGLLLAGAIGLFWYVRNKQQ
jgi:LPXTG-motif cell wall-anchored protein